MRAFTPPLLLLMLGAACGTESSDPATPVQDVGAGAQAGADDGTVPSGEAGAAAADAPQTTGDSVVTDPGPGVAPEFVPQDWRPTSDVLSELPDIVYLKTSTQSYNDVYYYAVMDGSLWIKPNVERTGNDGPWEKVALTPELEGRVAMVSVDDHGVVVFDQDRKLYWSMNEARNQPMVPLWTTSWGAPLSFGPGLVLPEPIIKWEYAVLTRQRDEYFVDPAGNHQLVGLGTVAHIWILNDDGQRITYIDPILPVDTSYEMCGPHRGRFQMVNLSTSGSTTFVINRHGDMYTRLYDFDISGADTLFFTYTYESMPGALAAPIKLPAPDWIHHPKVEGEITDRITIYKVTTGSDSRMLRVEGRDAAGRVGLFEKPITGMASSDWVFHPTDEPLRGNLLDNDVADRSLDTLGAGEDRLYTVQGEGWSAQLLDFNLYCAPSALRVTFDSGSVLDLVVHHTDAIRQAPREGRLTDEPRVLNGAIEVPETVWQARGALAADAAAFLQANLSATSRFTQVPLSASLGTVSLHGWNFAYQGE